jgi:hypothetical protein
MNSKQIILSHIKEYCKTKHYQSEGRGRALSLLCPFCKDPALTAQQVANTHFIQCLNPACPRKEKFTLISVVKKFEKKEKMSNSEIVEYLKTLLKVKVITDNDKNKINNLFTKYEKNGWSLVPIKRNDKTPIELNWTNKEHKDRREWWEWLNNELNLGVRTGAVSNLTVIDIDQKPIPKEVKEIMGDPLIAETTHGFHLFFSYDKDLPKCRVKDLKTDIENNNGQVVITPSIINDVPRKWLNNNEVIEMPSKFKEFLIKRR